MKQYYQQTDEKDVLDMEKYLIENGFKVEIQKAVCSLKRETSKYNKYMKWHLIQTSENGSISSQYFKTKPETLRHLHKPHRPMPIGNHMSLRHLLLRWEA